MKRGTDSRRMKRGTDSRRMKRGRERGGMRKIEKRLKIISRISLRERDILSFTTLQVYRI